MSIKFRVGVIGEQVIGGLETFKRSIEFAAEMATEILIPSFIPK